MDKKIMIIDDEKEICESMAAYLNENGYPTFYATNGAEGLRVIEKEGPRLLLLDIRMPNMDGTEVLRELNSRFPNLVVIIISGAQDAEMAKKVIELGVCEYVTKPVNMDTLMKNYIVPILGPPGPIL